MTKVSPSILLLILPLLIIILLGISVHPLFISEIFTSFKYITILSKVLLLISSIYLLKSLYDFFGLNKNSLFLFFFSASIFLLSFYTVQEKNILNPPSPVISTLFILIFIFTYRVTSSKKTLEINSDTYLKLQKYISILLFCVFIFLLISFALELFVKHSISNTFLKLNLIESGNIVFPFRSTGFLLDANRWALTLIILAFTLYSLNIKSKKLLKGTYGLLFLYLITTLSKTAFFILLLIACMKKKYLKIIIKGVLGATIFISLATVFVDFEYEGTGLQRRIDFTVESILSPFEARTLNERQETFSAAIEGMNKKLLTGYGFLGFTANTSDQEGITVHNTLFSAWVYWGLILGSIVFLAIYIIPFILFYINGEASEILWYFFIVVIIYINSLSVMHDFVLLLMLYLSLLSYSLNRKVVLT